jgi:hypothetical protein
VSKPIAPPLQQFLYPDIINFSIYILSCSFSLFFTALLIILCPVKQHVSFFI